MKPNPKFKSISKVSTEFNLPQHVLRFWESKFIQLSPLKLSGNHRYYRKVDIELIRYIKSLLYEDCISIKGVQKIFGNQKINKLLKSTNPLLQKQSSSKQIKIDTMSESKDKKKVKEIFRKITKGLQEIKNILKK
ncbi:MAG: hypothetical protein CFH23_00348 [Alphaproteobacteria bacterium MarineAlpha6_Bin1]|nr:MAG: hypothetical protein CFH23_00348 [Alphaproteobacteria bacterium MarineAlpha6_Bin1]